jgi:hypothetical protein
MATVIATQNRRLIDPKTRRTYEIKKGQSYKTTSHLYKIFNRRDNSIFVKQTINRNGADTRWTQLEYAAIAMAYIRNGANEQACLSEFRCISDRHSDYAVRLAVNSCKFLDSHVKDAKGLDCYAQGLLSALQDLAGDRFQGR